MSYETAAERDTREAKEAKAAEKAKADRAAAKALEESGTHLADLPDKDEKEAAAKIAADAKAELVREKADVRYARRADERIKKLAPKQKAVDDAGAALSKAQGELAAAGVEFDTKFDHDNPQTQADIDYAAGVAAQLKAANLRAGITE